MGTEAVTVGRRLDRAGDPVPGTGLTLDPESELAARLRRREGPLTSHPSRDQWAAALDTIAGTGGEYLRTLSLFRAGYEEPPPHYHTRSTETFEVLRGAFDFRLDGERRRVGAGETVRVPTGVPHTFDCAAGDPAAMLTEIRPPGTIGWVIPTLSGLAHDPAVDAGAPLQRVAVLDRLAGDTVFTSLPPGVGALVGLLAPLARARGYRGGHGKYRSPAFWERHVQQPDL